MQELEAQVVVLVKDAHGAVRFPPIEDLVELPGVAEVLGGGLGDAESQPLVNGSLHF